MARSDAESNRRGIEVMLRMMSNASMNIAEKGSMQKMLARGLAYGIPAARDVFFDQVVPVLKKEPSGPLAKALGWSESTVLRITRSPTWFRRLTLRNIRPGEPVSEAPFPSGVVLHPGDAVEFWQVDFEAGQLEPEGRVRVEEVRVVEPGHFDIYYGRKPGEVVCDVTYVGRSLNGDLVLAENERQTRVLEIPDPAAAVALPPPPGEPEFRRFEETTGLPLPPEVRTLFGGREVMPRTPIPKWSLFSSLQNLWPYLPPRSLRLVEGLCDGLELCVYFPRERVPPFLVVANPSWPGVWVWDSDLSSALERPEQFAEFCNGKSRPPASGASWWKHLYPDADSDEPGELQLFRPLFCDPEYLDSSELNSHLSPIFAKFGSTEAIPSLIRSVIPDTKAVRDSQRWLTLSEKLEAAGTPTMAIRAMENAHKAAIVGPASSLWTRVLVPLERLAVLMDRHGDPFDKVWIAAALPVARGFAKGNE